MKENHYLLIYKFIKRQKLRLGSYIYCCDSELIIVRLSVDTCRQAAVWTSRTGNSAADSAAEPPRWWDDQLWEGSQFASSAPRLWNLNPH